MMNNKENLKKQIYAISVNMSLLFELTLALAAQAESVKNFIDSQGDAKKLVFADVYPALKSDTSFFDQVSPILESFIDKYSQFLNPKALDDTPVNIDDLRGRATEAGVDFEKLIADIESLNPPVPECDMRSLINKENITYISLLAVTVEILPDSGEYLEKVSSIFKRIQKLQPNK